MHHDICLETHIALTPFLLGRINLKNRVVVAPMSRVSTSGDGVPTENMQRYYTTFAQGNFGMIISEGTYTDQAYSQAYTNQPGIVTTEQQHAWYTIVGAVHKAGSVMFLQLMHAGALSQGNRYRHQRLAPSAIQPKGQMMPEYGGSGPFPLPEAMTKRDIQEAITGFAQSALRAREAGFDGIEVHGANGYLIDQFLTNYTNVRTDDYGGSIEKRVRFAVEVLEAIRAVVGRDYPVGMRLSQTKVNDFIYRWPGGEKDAEIIFSALAAAGVSYIHIASEGRNWVETAMIGDKTTITQLARTIARVPVIANGGMHNSQQAASVLKEGHADLISLGSGALANPDWPDRLAEGRTIETFDHAMLQPVATIENALSWRAAHTHDIGHLKKQERA